MGSILVRDGFRDLIANRGIMDDRGSIVSLERAVYKVTVEHEESCLK